MIHYIYGEVLYGFRGNFMNFILLKLHQAGSIHSSFGKGEDEGPEKLREISRCADNQNWEPGFLNFSSSNQSASGIPRYLNFMYVWGCFHSQKVQEITKGF